MRDSTRYRILQRFPGNDTLGIHYPAHDKDLAKLINGDRGFRYDEASAYPGDIVDDLPATSAEGLLKAGRIVVAGTKADPYHVDAGASPAAVKLADSEGIDIDSVVGTGKDGLVTRKDVEALVVPEPWSIK